MDYTNRFDLMTETLSELAEEEQAHHTPPAPVLPSLRSVLADAKFFPRKALFLGVAEDRLPLLLNLYDPIPGPILITGDKSSGKTTLLQMIARAMEYLHTPSEVQYGVITAHPQEWNKFQSSSAKAGIYSVTDEAARELLQSLVTWAHNNKGDEQSIILLIDNLEEILKLDNKAEQNLRWLLLRGPSRRVWPFVTLNAGHVHQLNDWMEFFHTRLFGRVEHPDDEKLVTGNPNSSLHELSAGSQFATLEGNIWLNFWCPSTD